MSSRKLCGAVGRSSILDHFWVTWAAVGAAAGSGSLRLCLQLAVFHAIVARVSHHHAGHSHAGHAHAGHSHSHAPPNFGRVFAIAASLNVTLVVIQVVYGVRSMDPLVRDTAEVLRVTGLRRFSAIVLPSAAPFIATGLRIGAAMDHNIEGPPETVIESSDHTAHICEGLLHSRQRIVLVDLVFQIDVAWIMNRA